MGFYAVFLLALITICKSNFAAPVTSNTTTTTTTTTATTPAAHWPKGRYCILEGSGGACPDGFRRQSIRLSVPQTVPPSQQLEDGSRIIKFGRIGNSQLRQDAYDGFYILDFRVCCHVDDNDLQELAIT
jgi:hypothetical protein